MSSTKKTDLAQELVEFLLKEGGENPKETPIVEDKTVRSPAEFSLNLVDGDTPAGAHQTSPTPKDTPQTIRPSSSGKTDYKFSDTNLQPPGSSGPDRAQAILNEVSALVGGAEAIRVAQARILILERERDNLRDETEKLLSSSESLQRRVAEMKAQQEINERKHKERIEILEEEKIVFKGRLSARESELGDYKRQVDELQVRFQNDLRKVRVRERELENRQELLKAESVTLLQSKDEMILHMKRQLEQLHFELDNFRAKSADMNAKLNEFYDRNHRTVKAIRIALSVLETGDAVEDKKKAVGS
ncbi:MAG: hypothetical protein SGI74_05600 [Oligoflexia bacterium]|nr:hypothetical protein [Oligoflexia bacterium]